MPLPLHWIITDDWLMWWIRPGPTPMQFSIKKPFASTASFGSFSKTIKQDKEKAKEKEVNNLPHSPVSTLKNAPTCTGIGKKTIQFTYLTTVLSLQATIYYLRRLKQTNFCYYCYFDWKGFSEFVELIARMAVENMLQQPCYHSIFPTPFSKVLAILTVWGVADLKKLEEVRVIRTDEAYA